MLQNETLISFTQAAAYLPRRFGRKVHSSSIWRWARRGISGIQLECCRLRARFYTSAEALDRFADRLSRLPPNRGDKSDGKAIEPRPRTESEHQQAIWEAEKRLEDAGI